MQSTRFLLLAPAVCLVSILTGCSLFSSDRIEDDFSPSRESIGATEKTEICDSKLASGDAKSQAETTLADDPEAQKLQEIFAALGLTINLNQTTGCTVKEEMLGDGTSSQGVKAQQTGTGPIYTQTPVGSNGALHIVEGANEENNLWFSWTQPGENNVRKKITHVELFGNESALQTALAQNQALGVQFTVLDDYNKRRLIHQLSQFTTLKPQSTRGAGVADEYGLPVIETLSMDGRLLDVKNARAVVVNERTSPTSATQLIGEALIALPLVGNSRNGAINFELDDTLFIRIPVNAAASDGLWKIGIVQETLPPPLDQPKYWIPVASFTFSPQQPRHGQTVQFNASASSDVDGTVADYIWSFGDGSTAQGEASVSHLYAQPGSYQVSLTVVDDEGNSSQPLVLVVNVAALVKPVASFTYSPAQPTTGQAVQFNGSASSDADGTITSYNWNFGDGSTSQGLASVSHTYSTAGTFQATLTVVDNDGQSSLAATTTITVALPGPPPGELRVRIKSTSASNLQIQVVGHASWTPRHNFKIDMKMLTNLVQVYDPCCSSYQSNDGFQYTGATVTGDAAATVTQQINTGPHLEGAVGTGSVTYNMTLVSNVEHLRFTIQLDMDGNGTYEVGPSAVPIYVTVGTDTRRVVPTGTVTEFMLKRDTGQLLAFVMSNLRVCSATGTNCVVLSATSAASDMMGSLSSDWAPSVSSRDSWSTPVSSSDSAVRALNEPIILDPEILDYWKTELAIPKAVSLVTTTVKEVKRDNFYNNYTTEKVDALDIRAFARWGYDFESTFQYCPYVYYNDLAPFRRVLCVDYWTPWYQKQWDKGSVESRALQLHETASNSGMDTVVYVGEETRNLDIVLQGFDTLDVATVRDFLDSASTLNLTSQTLNPGKQAAIATWYNSDYNSFLDWVGQLHQAYLAGTYDQVYDNIIGFYQSISVAFENYLEAGLFGGDVILKDFIRLIVADSQFGQYYGLLGQEVRVMSHSQLKNLIKGQQAFDTNGSIFSTLEWEELWARMRGDMYECALLSGIAGIGVYPGAGLFRASFDEAVEGIQHEWGDEWATQFARAVLTVMWNVSWQMMNGEVRDWTDICAFVDSSNFRDVLISIAGNVDNSGTALLAAKDISKILVAGFALFHNPHLKWFAMNFGLSLHGNTGVVTTPDIVLYDDYYRDFIFIEVENWEITGANFFQRAKDYAVQLKKTIEFLESKTVNGEINLRNGPFERTADLAVLIFVFHGQEQSDALMVSMAAVIQANVLNSSYPIMLVWETNDGVVHYVCIAACEKVPPVELKELACSTMGYLLSCNAEEVAIPTSYPNSPDWTPPPTGSETEVKMRVVPPPVTSDCNFQGLATTLLCQYF